MSYIKKYWFVLGCLFLTFYMRSCGPRANGNWPGREYMPDMAHSQAYEYYSPGPGNRTVLAMSDNPSGSAENWLFADGMSARLPVQGTIPRGYMPFTYSADSVGYAKAGDELTNPFGRGDEKTLAEGKELYIRYCSPCHGDKGTGNGKISASNGGPLGSIPNYFNDTYYSMSEGKMYHSVHYGKNLMGSYAQQMSSEQRWKAIAYIKKMQADKVAADKKMDLEAAYAYVRGAADKRVYTSGGGRLMSEGTGAGLSVDASGDVHGGSSIHTLPTTGNTTLTVGSSHNISTEEEIGPDGKKRKKKFIEKVVDKVKEGVENVKENRAERKAEKALKDKNH
jgi:mono/diheme cytochrome c family protein